ncbi:MAG: hypothetical protein ACOYYS_16340 [Chloroflexota bacterium]
MKVVESNSGRLVLRSSPSVLIVLGLLFALLDLPILYFFARSVTIHCERLEPKQITCTLNEKLFDAIPVRQRTIENVQGAEVETYSDSDGDTYKVVLLTTGGRIPLTPYSSSGYDDKAAVVAQVNQFVGAGRQDVLDIQQPVTWWLLLMLLIFGGVGVSMLLFAKTVQVEMDRSQGVLRIRKTGLLGSRTNEFLLREVEDISLESMDDNDGGTTYRIRFRMHTGEEIPLTSFYSSSVKDKQRAIDMMKEFLSPYRSTVL